ncbi:MAG: class I SAM-dependent methyltransferase [Rhizomicrobium sp.]
MDSWIDDSFEGKFVENKSYQFTTDWFSGFIKNFERNLAQFKGTPAKFIEIGTYEGRSTVWLLDNILTHPQAQLHSIDPYPKPLFFSNAKQAGVLDEATGMARGLTFYASKSVEVLRQLPMNTFDFVYVDGDHSTSAALQDAVLSFALLKEGGILAFDDYLWNDWKNDKYGTTKLGIDAFMTVFRNELEVLGRGYQVWVRKVRDRRAVSL